MIPLSEQIGDAARQLSTRLCGGLFLPLDPHVRSDLYALSLQMEAWREHAAALEAQARLLSLTVAARRRIEGRGRRPSLLRRLFARA